MGDVDWIARGAALFAVALGAVNFYFARRESRWKRRNVTIQPLRAPIRALLTAVEGRSDPRLLEALFTAQSGAELQQIVDEVGKVPDRKFRRDALQFASQLKAVRGARVLPDAALTKAQNTDLAAAETLGDKLTARMDKAARLGSG